jgi:type I restriction-modification system DNA methylase subunit
LKERTFWGFDRNDTVAVPFARTNMLMADDGGVNIKVTDDSLIKLLENTYDYILANVPYGKYEGEADITSFSYTNTRRFELLFLEKIVKALKPGGKASIIVPDGLVESTSNSIYRHRLLFDVVMEAVVSLPPFIFVPYTSEKTYVLFFRKKRLQEQGQLQESPVYHFIVDQDGFQDGKKRYPINENDFPLLEASFCQREIPNKARFVDISEVNEDSYYSLCSEYYIRRINPLEISFDEFKSILEDATNEVVNCE